MNDLFDGVPEYRSSVPENPGEPRKVSGLLLGFPPGKGKSGKAGLSLPGKPGKSGRTSLSPQREPRREMSELLEDRNELLLEVDVASSQHESALQAFWDAKKPFDEATEDLLGFWSARRNGGYVNKATMLKAYDRRMYAGMELFPFKEALRVAELYRSACLKELAEINREIERHEKRMA